MKTVEDYLQKIDTSFGEKSQKDIKMIYIMILIVLVALSYIFFWETSVADFKSKRAQVVAEKDKIAVDNQYLSMNPESKITMIKKDTEKAQKDTLVYKENNQYIKTKIEEISALVYDEQTWGEYLHSISKYAKKNNIKILEFNNKVTKSGGSFGHVLDIEISSSGKFKNTVKFINSLEQSDLVVDLHDFNVKAESELNSKLNIAVWGITY